MGPKSLAWQRGLLPNEFSKEVGKAGGTRARGFVDSVHLCPTYCSAASGQGLDVSFFILGYVLCEADAG